MSEENEFKVTIDHSGGYCSGCLQVVAVLVVAPAVLYVLVQVDWLQTALAVLLWAVVALVVLVISLDLGDRWKSARDREYRRLAEANGERRRAALAGEEEKRREVERERLLVLHREYEVQLSQHQERMRRDKTYQDRWVALCKRRLIAEQVCIEADNPYLDQVTHSVTDADAWEYAFANTPDEADVVGESDP